MEVDLLFQVGLFVEGKKGISMQFTSRLNCVFKFM